METLRYVATLYQPFVPETASRLLDQLGVPQGEARNFAALHPGGQHTIKGGTPLPPPEMLIPRIEIEEAEVSIAAVG